MTSGTFPKADGDTAAQPAVEAASVSALFGQLVRETNALVESELVRLKVEIGTRKRNGIRALLAGALLVVLGGTGALALSGAFVLLLGAVVGHGVAALIVGVVYLLGACASAGILLTCTRRTFERRNVDASLVASGLAKEQRHSPRILDP